VRDAWRHFIAEFIGTFGLVFIGSGAIMSAGPSGSPTGIALAHGLIFALMVTATMRISGHLNPAITAGFLVTGRIEPMMAATYWVAQILGAVVAALALKGLFPAEAVQAAQLGRQIIGSNVSLAQATGLEAVATFLLVFVVFGTAVDPKAPRVGGFAIGLAVTVGMLAIGPLTGGSMNPARSFGPAAVMGAFDGQAAYWVGPLLGGIAAALLYDQLFIRRDREPVDHGAIEPAE